MQAAPVGSLIVGLALDHREAAALSDRLSLRDIEGNTAAFLKVSLPSELLHEGLVGLFLAFIALVIMAIISTLAVIFIVDRLILDRVSRLGREFTRVAPRQRTPVRIDGRALYFDEH